MCMARILWPAGLLAAWSREERQAEEDQPHPEGPVGSKVKGQHKFWKTFVVEMLQSTVLREMLDITTGI